MAAAWPPARGKGQLIFKLSTFQGASQFDENSQAQPYPNSGVASQQEANLYLEYGLTSTLTLVADLYADLPAYQDSFNHFETLSFGTEQLALRYRLSPANSPMVWAIQGLVKVPADPTNVSPVAGDRQVDLEARLLAGHTWPIAPYYPFVDLEGAYRYRFGYPPSQIRLDATVGAHLGGRWMAIVDGEGITSLPGGRLYVPPGSDQLRDPSFDLYKGEASIVYRLAPGWHLQAGAFDNLAGRNTGAGLGLFAASWWGW